MKDYRIEITLKYTNPKMILPTERDSKDYASLLVDIVEKAKDELDYVLAHEGLIGDFKVSVDRAEDIGE